VARLGDEQRSRDDVALFRPVCANGQRVRPGLEHANVKRAARDFAAGDRDGLWRRPEHLEPLSALDLQANLLRLVEVVVDGERHHRLVALHQRRRHVGVDEERLKHLHRRHQRAELAVGR
jgi:hypothetical protein